MFTRNQIEELRKKLQLSGIKDTQFPPAKELRGDEILALVQEGRNVQMGLKSFIDKTIHWNSSDFINISKSTEDTYTLKDVVNLVDPISRKAGQVITFMDSETKDWAIYQFKGTSSSEWFNLEKWDNILAKVDNHFKGWFLTDELLFKYYPRPKVGDFAFIGPTLEEAITYLCIATGEWYNTKLVAVAFADKFDAVYSKDFGELETIEGETYADRATKDALGNIIHDTYVTRKGLTEAINQAVTEAVTKTFNNFVLPEGSVTVESLSEAVLQLLSGRNSITNMPDEEDITVKDEFLKFADKEYSETAFSGYGRKYLRKNIIDGINILEPYQVSQPNTRYIVQYFYCLNDKTIEIPDNCIIDMSAGGIISNGTIICNNTVFIVPRKSDLNVTLEGTYSFFGE